MKLKIKAMCFQRNGVCGEPFYHALISYNEGGESFENMLVTFRSENDKQIRYDSCRVVNLDNMQKCWRGDVIAEWLQTYFDKEMENKGGTIYDCCTKQDLYTI